MKIQHRFPVCPVSPFRFSSAPITLSRTITFTGRFPRQESFHVQATTNQILEHLKSETYRPQKRRAWPSELNLFSEEQYADFQAGSVRPDARGPCRSRRRRHGCPARLASQATKSPARIGKTSAGLVLSSPPIRRATKIFTSPKATTAARSPAMSCAPKSPAADHRDGKAMFSGQITEIIARTQKRSSARWAKSRPVGRLAGRQHADRTDPHPRCRVAAHQTGTKVVVELTTYPANPPACRLQPACLQELSRAQGVITEVLGQAGEKDVDLQSVIVQFNLPGPFPEPCETRPAMRSIASIRECRTTAIGSICPIKIDLHDRSRRREGLRRRDQPSPARRRVLGTRRAHCRCFAFCPDGTALDEEATERGNSSYFPGYVIPMLPEILSNGVCSLAGRRAAALQERVHHAR